MQQPSPADLAAAPNATRRVVARSGCGDGSRVFVVDAPSRGTIADVKRMLCLPPHSVCSDASALELVLKGEVSTAANARTHNTVSCFFGMPAVSHAMNTRQHPAQSHCSWFGCFDAGLDSDGCVSFT
jgi:hypothetical protein